MNHKDIGDRKKNDDIVAAQPKEKTNQQAVTFGDIRPRKAR